MRSSSREAIAGCTKAAAEEVLGGGPMLAVIESVANRIF